MRRPSINLLAQATVAISLGVLVTYASGWAIAIWTTSDSSGIIVRRPGGTLAIDVPGEWTNAIGTQLREFVVEHPYRRFERIEGALARADDARETFGGFFRKRETVGWPMAALTGEEWSLRFYTRLAIGETSASTPPRTDLGRQQLETSRGLLVVTPRQVRFVDEPKKLPWIPVWPGFAVDALLGAAVVWFLLLGPRSIRRWRRARRGACIHCGHRLISRDERCPECGDRNALVRSTEWRSATESEAVG